MRPFYILGAAVDADGEPKGCLLLEVVRAMHEFPWKSSNNSNINIH